MEESTEIVLEKLLHVTKDMVAKVYLPLFSLDIIFRVILCKFVRVNNLIFFVATQISDEATRCINVLLAKYDHFRCLAVCTNPLLYVIVNYVSIWCN